MLIGNEAWFVRMKGSILVPVAGGRSLILLECRIGRRVKGGQGGHLHEWAQPVPRLPLEAKQTQMAPARKGTGSPEE